MSKRFLILLMCLCPLFSLSAFAVDGVVLINQASVNAAGGFPYKITVSGSYKLSGNLTVSGSSDAIQVNADNVTLDLNGFSIVGPVVCDGDSNNTTTSCTSIGTGGGGTGILAFQNNVTIRNGTIQGMSFAIKQGGAGALVEEVHAFKNGFGIAVFRQGVVRRNMATNNLGDGIFAQRSVVSENVSARNEGSGIAAFGSTVTDNAMSNNGSHGISANDSKLRDNMSIGNAGFGYSGLGSLFGSNSFVGNTGGSVSGTNVSQGNNNCNGTAC